MRVWSSAVLRFLCTTSLVCGGGGRLFQAGNAAALEEKFEDLSTSVEVAPVFSLSIDNPNLAFGPISSEGTVVLGSGRFFNEIRCRSNSGRPWYLKAHLLSLKQLESNTALPPASLKWKTVESTGKAEPIGDRTAFHAFAAEPVLLYASQGDDDRGHEVTLRLQYSLTTATDTQAGHYAGQVVFTMAESP